MSDKSGISDAIQVAMDMARDLREGAGIVGYGIIELWHPDGSLGLVRPFANMVTDTGDLYYIQQAIAGIPPASATGAATKMTGMQIGPTNTAVAKNGTGSKLEGAILAGQAFDATYPQAAALAAGAGAEATYKTTFAAGTGTGTINEATLTNGTIGTASTSGNTIARILTGVITKAAGDSLAITWKTKFLGS